MELILKESFYFNSNISDFAIDPLNSTLITVGEGLDFFKDGKNTKKLKGKKLKKSLNLRFIKYQNQLFPSNDFYVISSDFSICKIDGKKRSVISHIDIDDKYIDTLMVNSAGQILYISNNVLYANDINLENLRTHPLNITTEGRYKMYLSGNIVVIKYRKIHSQDIRIMFFAIKDLSKMAEITSVTNHIYSKVIGSEYIASTDNGLIEVWDIINSVVRVVHDLNSSKITYIENDEKYIYFGNIKGELIITDYNYNIVKREKVYDNEIKRIVIFNSKVYVLSANDQMKVFDILGLNDFQLGNEKKQFLNKYNIHESYEEFFDIGKILAINKFLEELKVKGVDYTPKDENIFKAFSKPLDSLKVCIVGKDPYFQKGVATGLAFEVKSENWDDEKINASLKNILKLIYKTYNNEILDIANIRAKIKSKSFNILNPEKLFESWQNQGVLLINSSLTTVVGSAGAHHEFWEDIVKEFIQFVDSKNENIIYLLWGNDAAVFEKHIKNGEIIKHNHPAIAGNLNNKNDFLLGQSFEKTKNLINWLGE